MKNLIRKTFSIILLCSIICVLFPVATHAAQKGWETDGRVHRYRIHSTYVKNCVRKIKGKYYYFNKKGIRKYGWRTYKGKRYYFDKKTGAAYVGEQTIKKNKYFFRKNGRLIKKEGVYRRGDKIYYLKKQGKVFTGIIKVKKNWYYFDGEGNRIKLPDFQKYRKLMIVAHPDDESLWGGAHLLDGDYFVVCLTNGNNPIRRAEFYNALKEYGCKGFMFSYPDVEGGKRSDWSRDREQIVRDINAFLTCKDWNLIATHNPRGEYGHIQHQMTSNLVTAVYRNRYQGNKLFYFGKYYKYLDLLKIKNQLTSIPEFKLQRKTQIIDTVYRSQDVKWDKHMMPYENWIGIQNWIE